MGQYLDLAKQSTQRSSPMPDALRPATVSSDGCNVPMPGARIRWLRGDGDQAQGKVIEVLIDPSADPSITVLVILDGGGWSVLNPHVVKFDLIEM